MNLSKSKYTCAMQCKKILWLDKYKKEERVDSANDAVLDNGTKVGILAQELFKDYKVVKFDTNLSNMIKETNELLKEDVINICEASLTYNNNFCSVDILKKVHDEFEIYEVKSSTHVNDIYLEDVSFQYYVLKKLGLNVKKACIVYINSNYVRHGKLNLNELFSIRDVTDVAMEKFDQIDKNINDIENYMTQVDEPYEDLDTRCFSPYECPYFKYCSRSLEKNNIFDVRGLALSKKINFYKKGYKTFKELLSSNIGDKYKQQIEFELNNLEPYINKNNIKKVLDKLYYPMYFLDFESYQEAVPEFDGISPYMQIPFQYSLHYQMSEDAPLKHTEFLSDANVDPRRKLAEKLVSDIKQDACVLAYNMAFEKMVIKHLANMYPDLKDKLLNIHDHIQDLIVPFRQRDYYVKEMQGSFSIKYVLPALFPNDPSLDYHNLDLVHKGDEASNAFKDMRNMNKETLEKYREYLLRYCELDTYAMVKIHQKLKSIIEK